MSSSGEFAEALRQARPQLGFSGARLPLALDCAPPAAPPPSPPTRTMVESGRRGPRASAARARGSRCWRCSP